MCVGELIPFWLSADNFFLTFHNLNWTWWWKLRMVVVCAEWNSLNETCLANLIIANPQSMDRQKCFFAFVACKDGTFLVNLSGVISLISFTFMNLNCKRHLKGSLHLHHWSGVNPAPSNRGSQELLAQIYQRRQGGLRSPNKRLWSILLLSM